MKILMVCLGNICRSPLAEGILQHMIDSKRLDWKVDSAGTAGYHEGELPDSRSIKVARENGIDITDQRSRKLTKVDFSTYNLILAMDASNYNNILSLKPNDSNAMVKMLLNYSHPGQNRQVPDPYYGGGFESVYDMISEACEKVISSHLPKDS